MKEGKQKAKLERVGYSESEIRKIIERATGEMVRSKEEEKSGVSKGEKESIKEKIRERMRE